jgi:hypothetical protein
MQELIDELVEMQKTIEDTDFMSFDKHIRAKNQKNINLFYDKLDKMVKKLKKLQLDKELEIYFDNLQKKQ